MKLIALAVVLLLVGCCPKPLVLKEPVEVKVPVAVPCIRAMPEVPKWELEKPESKNGDIFAKGTALLIELEQRRAYELQLESVMKPCIGE